MVVWHRSLNRRAFVTGLVTSGLSLAIAPARAGDPIEQAIQGGAVEWSDGFDAAASKAPDVRTFTPILSPEIVQAVGSDMAEATKVEVKAGS